MTMPEFRSYRIHRVVAVAGGLLVAAVAALHGQTITGTVYRDYNANGVRDAREPGVPGLTLEAFNNGGGSVGSATTGATGAYSVAVGVPNGTPLRLELSGLPVILKAGAASGGSRTSVTFTTAGASGVDLGVNNPAHYCQDNPNLATACYVFGNQAVSNDPVLVSFEYNAGSTEDPAVSGPPFPAFRLPAANYLAQADEIGPTWGLAYQRSSGIIFAGSFYRRHVSVGPGGGGASRTGTIYRVNATGAPAPAAFLDLEVLFGADHTGRDPRRDTPGYNPATYDFDRDNRNCGSLAAPCNTAAYRNAIWDAVGKIGLGGLAMADDDRTLYTINLANRQLYEIPIGSPPVAPPAASIGRFNLPVPASCNGNDGNPGNNPDPVSTDLRWYAVEVYDGLTYVGGVCSAESTQQVSDLRGYVYSFDPATDTFTARLEFALNYPRGQVWEGGGFNEGTDEAEWNTWRPTYIGNVASNQFHSYPQPALTDLAFDNGDLMIAMRDRYADQVGPFNLSTDPSNTWGSGAVSAGDLLRACLVAGAYVLEANGVCGGVTTAGPIGNASGPANSEYYFRENFATVNTMQCAGGPNAGNACTTQAQCPGSYCDLVLHEHDETATGALTSIQGRAEAPGTVFDPIFNGGDSYNGGVLWFPHGTGARVRGYVVYEDTAVTFQKGNGLGDLEPLCAPAPLEIGNRLWQDTDGNGRQDPGEPVLAGVTVNIYNSANVLIGTATTDASGQFVFGGRNNTNLLVGQSITESATYTVAINPATLPGGMAPTIANYDLETRDSDGIVLSSAGAPFDTWPGRRVTTARAGHNDHHLDFGFAAPAAVGYDLAVRIRAVLAPSSVGGPVSFLLEVFNQGSATATDVIVRDFVDLGHWLAFSLASNPNGTTGGDAAIPYSWATDGTHGYVTLGGALLPGHTVTVPIVLTSQPTAPLTVLNYAEIWSDDGADIDSIEESIEVDNNNDPLLNDVVNNAGGDEDDHDIASASLNGSTLALVTDFRLTRGARGVVAEWRTASEVGTLGFDIYRLAGDRWLPVAGALLPSPAGAAAGAVYQFHDAEAPAGQQLCYQLVEAAAFSRELVFGPYCSLAADHDQDPPPAGFVAAGRGPTALERARADASRREQADRSPLAAGALARQLVVRTPARGVYEISAATLAARLELALGEVAERLQNGSFQLRRAGVSVGWWPRATSALRFFGRPGDSPYSLEGVYLLNAAPGTLAGSVGGGSPAALEPGSFIARRDVEQDRFAGTAVARDPSSDYWYWKALSAGNSASETFTSTFDLVSLVDSEVGLLEVEVFGASTAHRLSVSLNGFGLGARSFGPGAASLPFEVPANLLAASNQLQLRAELPPGAANSVVYVDSFVVRYRRALRAEGETLEVEAVDGTPITVGGFGAAGIEVLEIGDAERPRRVTSLTIEQSAGRFSVTFEPAGAGARYWVSAAPTSAPLVDDVDALPGGEGDYVIVAPRGLLAQAERLAELRSASGFSTLVVPLEAVYAAFADGEPTPLAIRSFLSRALAQWQTKPRFVVLVGKGSYDYRNLLDAGPNLLPPLLVATSHGLFASDAALADVTGGDGVPDLAIGRLPVVTAAELELYLDKLERHRPWRGEERAVLVADDADAAGDFSHDSALMAARLPEQWDVENVSLGELGLEGARAALFGAFAQGHELLNYLGHGGLDRITAEGLLRAEDAPALAEAVRLPLFLALTCTAGRFEVPGMTSLAEALVLEAERGAIAAVSPSGVSFHRSAVELDRLLLDALQREETVGEALREALAELRAREPASDLALVYSLFGDPALPAFDGGGAPAGLVFEDDFESGSAARWSAP